MDKNKDFLKLLEDVDEPKWLTSLRLKAFEVYNSMDWPSPSEEEWRRTDITGIDFNTFRLPEIKKSKAIRTVIRGNDNSGAISVWPLCKGDYSRRDSLREIMYGMLNSFDNKFVAWNFSAFNKGAHIVIPGGHEGGDVLYVTLSGDNNGNLSIPHIVIEGEKNSQASVVISFDGRFGDRDSDSFLVNSGIDVVLHEGATLRLFLLQNISSNGLFFNNVNVSVMQGGMFESFESNFGGKLVKTKVVCSLNGTGSEARLDGVYFPTDNQHMDIRTVQKHRIGHTNSRLFYKGAVKDSGRAVFQGLIEVYEDARKTDAYLTDKNLILSDGARADSIPTLKIRNNDVRCSHGSTTGKIDEEELYYLESRGISESNARRMLISGFFAEILESIVNESVKSNVSSMVEKKI